MTPQTKANKKPTPRQAKFIQEYIRCSNARQAAINAGYTEQTATDKAHNLLKRPEIVAELNAVRAKWAEENKFTMTKAHDELCAGYERAVKLNQMQAAAKFAELKLKLHGMLIEKHDITAKSSLVISISGLTRDPISQIKTVTEVLAITGPKEDS